MPQGPENYNTYAELMSSLWGQAQDAPEAHTLSLLVAAESCWLQVPDEEAATARPDLDVIDDWAKKIEGTKSFDAMLNRPKLGERLAARDAEGLMTDFHDELSARLRKTPDAPERERAAEKQQEREQTRRVRKAPGGPSL